MLLSINWLRSVHYDDVGCDALIRLWLTPAVRVARAQQQPPTSPGTTTSMPQSHTNVSLTNHKIISTDLI